MTIWKEQSRNLKEKTSALEGHNELHSAGFVDNSDMDLLFVRCRQNLY